MTNAQGVISSTVDARVARIGSKVHFGREYGGRPQRVFAGDQDALATVSRWEYCDYREWCVGWFY